MHAVGDEKSAFKSFNTNHGKGIVLSYIDRLQRFCRFLEFGQLPGHKTFQSIAMAPRNLSVNKQQCERNGL